MKPIKELHKNKRDIKIAFLTTISQTMIWFNLDRIKYLKSKGFANITMICNMDESFMIRYKGVTDLIPLKIERGVKPKNLLYSITELTKIFKKEKFDVIYYLTPNVSYCAALAGKRANVPIRIYGQSGIRYVSESGVKRLILKHIEKVTCKKSSIVRSQSPLNMRFAINEKLVLPNKIGVVGIGGTTGVDLSLCDAINLENTRRLLREKYGIPNTSCVYGFVGRLNKDKGCNELLEAFKAILEDGYDCYLIHLGMVDDSNNVTQNNYEFYLNSNRIIKTGSVSQEQVYEHMAAMDIMVHPTYREGFGKVLQEAMGMRLPIITTDVIGPKEVVEDGISGILVPVKNPIILKRKMLELLKDGELRKKLAINGRLRAEKYFDRKIMLENFYQDFKRCIGVDDD